MANDKKGPIPAQKLYGKRPLTQKELAEKAGFYDERAYEQHRKEPDMRPEHANWKKKSWKNL